MTPELALHTTQKLIRHANNQKKSSQTGWQHIHQGIPVLWKAA
jgi:hypothetical protein